MVGDTFSFLFSYLYMFTARIRRLGKLMLSQVPIRQWWWGRGWRARTLPGLWIWVPLLPPHPGGIFHPFLPFFHLPSLLTPSPSCSPFPSPTGQGHNCCAARAVCLFSSSGKTFLFKLFSNCCKTWTQLLQCVY